MNNNTAILNCLTKEISFRFEDKFFNLDLTEGDLEDYWNSINFWDGVTLDANFSWEDEPSLTLYGLIYNKETNCYEVNTNEAYPIRITNVFGTKAQYFGYEFQPKVGVNHLKVYANSKLVKRTTSPDIASDLCAKLRIVDKIENAHITITDKYGASEIFDVEEKYLTNYRLKSKKIIESDVKIDARIKYKIK